MRISDWSSDVCSSDLVGRQAPQVLQALSHLALLAERLHPQTLERLQIAGRGHTIQQAVLQLLEVLHRLKTPTSALPSGAFGKSGRASGDGTGHWICQEGLRADKLTLERPWPAPPGT